MKIVYYITGHGFGHATRSIGLIECLLSHNNMVDVVSSLNPSFFSHLPITCHRRELDVGAIQVDALHVDPIATLRSYNDAIDKNMPYLIDCETQFLRNGNYNLVLIDATPIACAAAANCNLPCIIVSNLTWDEIYREIFQKIKDSLALSDIEDFQQMISRCTDCYCKATHYFSLPGQMRFPLGFNGCIVDMPLVCRRARSAREEVLHKFNIPSGYYIAMISFGGQKTTGSWNLCSISLPPNWIGLLMGCTESMCQSNGQFISIPSDAYVPDIVAISDCVIGKLGYGTVSECLSNGTPLIYVPRTFWPEESYLETFLADQNYGIMLSEHDFLTGNWIGSINCALQLKNSVNVDSFRSISYECVYDAIMDIFKE